MCEEYIKNMEVENIFIPAKEKENPTFLYVTFKNILSVMKVYEKTRLMRKESRILNYIPWQFQDRLRAISAIDFEIRQNKVYQTRIKMGPKGLELNKKVRGSSRWEKVILPKDLPPVNLSEQPPALITDSPPPGRPRLSSKRGRESSGSDSEQVSSKVVKQSDRSDGNSNALENKKSFRERLEKANLVSDGVASPEDNIQNSVTTDKGNFTSIVGLQGATCKTKTTKFLTAQSPVKSKVRSSKQ